MHPDGIQRTLKKEKKLNSPEDKFREKVILEKAGILTEEKKAARHPEDCRWPAIRQEHSLSPA